MSKSMNAVSLLEWMDFAAILLFEMLMWTYLYLITFFIMVYILSAKQTE